VGAPLWSVEHPVRLTVHSEVLCTRCACHRSGCTAADSAEGATDGGSNRGANGHPPPVIADTVSSTIGLRLLEWMAVDGLRINGRPFPLRGFANHEDFGGVGVGVPPSLQAYRVSQLKAMGANAWRTAHNPPDPALLEACDQLGFLVMLENRWNDASAEGIESFRATVRAHRHRPSVIAWSLCNEGLCVEGGTDAIASATALASIVRTHDTGAGGRAVTAALNRDAAERGGGWIKWSHVLDVIGINYAHNEWDRVHALVPQMPIVITELSSAYADRHTYGSGPSACNEQRLDPAKRTGQQPSGRSSGPMLASTPSTCLLLSANDERAPPWGSGAESSWCEVFSRPYLSGAFKYAQHARAWHA